MIINAQPATAIRDTLGEGVIWDDRTNEVVWVDILNGKINRGQLTADEVVITSTVTLEGFVGAVGLAEDGGVLAAGSRGLVTISPEGDISYGPDLMGDLTDVRWNDGSVDPQGRFILGSLALNNPGQRERLLRINPGGNTEVLRTGLTLSNGVGFSPDGATIYHVDSLAGTVSAHSYGPGAFDTDEDWKTVLDRFNATPDGLTVDTEGNLWVAEWGAGRVRQYAIDGTVLQVVKLQAPHTTSAAFIGENLDVLAITTATTGINHPERDGSGFLHLARPGTKGLPTPRWAGSTRTPSWDLAPAAGS
ncbi:sugar lactone lactonase YvrE [Arthrobacter sp. SLBN-100]|uniref:SMP-30/gluconolactonase/LRE family protein n=1 Tax=Arthrobacter sp. SLBN-100 TaxID=2768450 RepID=UPI00114F01B7|nr:SMP-30/gluconolactonase/LRE family protein [Arthrobacter sp. SLBN-100]TQJ66254.1 sugar lactone lactonase YvrE [Arthrobacter sp. SLBN-100]